MVEEKITTEAVRDKEGPSQGCVPVSRSGVPLSPPQRASFITFGARPQQALAFGLLHFVHGCKQSLVSRRRVHVKSFGTIV